MLENFKKYSTNLICHCFPLLSACLANLKDGRIFHVKEKKRDSKQEREGKKLIIYCKRCSTLTSRIDLTSGFCTWNSLRKSSLEKQSKIQFKILKNLKNGFFIYETAGHNKLTNIML